MGQRWVIAHNVYYVLCSIFKVSNSLLETPCVGDCNPAGAVIQG